jgi:catecholate siderophore receptor
MACFPETDQKSASRSIQKSPDARQPSRKGRARIARSANRVGALIATATLGTAGLARASEIAEPVLTVAIGRAERSIREWEHPWDVMLAAHGLVLTQGAVATQAPVFRFDIKSGSMSDVIRIFEKQTGLAIAMPTDVGTITSPGVAGVFTADQALTRLLAGTALAHRFAGAGAVEIQLHVQDAVVHVHDRLPSSSSVKFSQPLVDTPQTVTVVPRAVIESQGATSLRDVLRNVPGITMQAGEGGGGLPGDSLSIRGFSASSDIFIDGVRDVGAYSRDAFNLEQVEVIKGPASTFGGRGSTGGAVNLSTKTPMLEALRRGTLAFGNAGSQRVTADVNEAAPNVAGGTAVRVNAMWQDAGVAGRDLVNNGSWAVAPTIAVGLQRSTRATLSYQHLRQNNVPDYGLPWGTSTDPATGEVFQTGALNATPAVDQSNFYGLKDYDFEDITNDVATLRVDHSFGSRTRLQNSTRYGATHRDSAITAPRPPNRQLQRREMRNEAFANQTALTATLRMPGVQHDITSGFEAGNEETLTRNSAQTTNQPQISLRSPNPDEAPFGPMPAITGDPSTATTATLGAYLFDTATIGPHLELSGGVRWDRSDVRYRLTTQATGAVTELARVDNVLSWRGGAVYKPRPNGSVYAGYGTSFNPASDAGAVGTALSTNATAVNSVNLDPEKSRNAEVGTKWSFWEQRLALTTAFFRTEKTNARTRNLTSDPFVLAGRQRVQGIEVGASGQIVPGLNALASYSYLRSEIVDTANTAEAGRDLALVPKGAASLWLTWQIQPRTTVGGGAQYMDSVFRNTTTDLKVPSYWLINAVASYEINSHLSLRLNATNLGDKSYVDRVGGGHYIPGPRRSLQLTTGIGF